MNTNKKALRKERGLIISIISKIFESKIEDLNSEVEASNKIANEAKIRVELKNTEIKSLQENFTQYENNNKQIKKSIGKLKIIIGIFFLLFAILFIISMRGGVLKQNSTVLAETKNINNKPMYLNMYRAKGYYYVNFQQKPSAVNLLAYARVGKEIKSLEIYGYQSNIDLKEFILHDFTYEGISEFEIFATDPEGGISDIVKIYNNQGFLTTEKP